MVKVEVPGPAKAKEHEQAHSVKVEAGHLKVVTAVPEQIVAIYAPGMWCSATVER